MIANIDLETRSTIDLRALGVYRYAECADTGIWCMSWALDGGEPNIWVEDEPFPEPLAAAIAAGAELRGWNVAFERIMWRDVAVPRYGFPEVPMEQFHCTMADAIAMGLPRSLEECALVLKLQQQKDAAGYQMMLRMARPRTRTPLTWWNVPERLAILYEYCKQDVRTERAVYKATRRIDARERAVYLADQRINDRGVLVDVPLARAGLKIVAEGLRRANESLVEVTGGAVEGVTKVADLTAWLKDAHGIDEGGVRKSVVRELLEGELPAPARVALEARAEAGRSSVAKIQKMLDVRCADDRLRGLFLYHGAGPGRWSGKLVQPQNFPRADVSGAEELIPEVLVGAYDLIDAMHPPLSVITTLLRGMLRASPGHRLLVGDFAQIEARVLAWLARQDDLVSAFAHGGKIYEEMAAAIYRLPVDVIKKGSPERQMGKDTILGCGYQMGHETFRRQLAEKQGVKVSEEFAETAVKAYRDKYPKIPDFWRRLNTAALNATERAGETFEVNGCRLVVRSRYLWLVLPSGRPLCYPAPKLVERETPWGELRTCVQVWGVNGYTRKWEPYALYGGLLTENVVQALARDLLASAILRHLKAGYPVVMHSHDEIVADAPQDHGSLEEFLALMKRTPAWAKGCPIEVEGWADMRYRK